MKRSAFVFIALLLTTTVLTAGCTVNTSNPFSHPTAAPTATPKPDYSATFASALKGNGWTPVNSISQLNDTMYSGPYKKKPDANGTSFTYEVKIEIAQSEAEQKNDMGN